MSGIGLTVPSYMRQLPPSLVIRFLLDGIGRGKVIYLITCLISGEQYVGETGDFRSRIQWHVRDLRGCRHHSKAMQRAFNSYGVDAFGVEILENCDSLGGDLRRIKEGFYIRTMQPAFNS